MTKGLVKKLKEALISVLPVSMIVIILYFTPLLSLTAKEIWIFIAASISLVIGIGLFNLGADLAMTPMGEHTGAGLTKSRNLILLLSVCFVMGVLITIAEPDLSVLAAQVADVINGKILIISIGVGVGLFLVLAIVKIVFRLSLSSLLMYFYMLLFALASLVVINGNEAFLPMAFDSGGVTTGPITVPFIMSLGVGIASTLGGKGSGENSFGLVSLCSIGPVLAVCALGISINGNITYELPDYSIDSHLGDSFLACVGGVVGEVALALGLIVAFFLILQVTFLRLPAKKMLQITVGIAYTFLGLVIFLTTVTVGFMPIGYKMGTMLAVQPKWIIVVFAFVLGFTVVLAEPAVHVLNKQVEEVTDGAIKKKSVLTALSIGVGISIGLSLIRIIFGFSILYYLIPGYFISLGLSFFVPKIYTAIAFDSGGVASGPLTSSFVLPFAIGACSVIQGNDNILSYAFGIVAMVAMTPLITIQFLGFKTIVSRKVKEKAAMKRILDADDGQILDFI